MSTSKRSIFKVVLNGAQAEHTQITVFDGGDREVASGHGDLEKQLPHGLYSVRLDRGQRMHEEVVRHDGPSRLDWQALQRNSSVPLNDTSTHHEYYQQASYDYSTDPTRPAIRGGGGWLFLLFRAVHGNWENPLNPHTLTRGLTLHDAHGRIISRLPSSETKNDAEEGWVAFSAPARPGAYFLLASGKRRRALPLRVFDGFNTQVFVTCYDGPHLETASVLTLPVGRKFDPNDDNAYAADMALSSLVDRQVHLSDSQINDLLYAKFFNPMYGLLGAYVLLLSGREKQASRFQLILRNLGRLMPGAADLEALKVLIEERLGKRWTSEVRPVSRPPLLRVGLDALVRASQTTHPDIIMPHSIAEVAAVKAYRDCVWTTWPTTKSQLRDGLVKKRSEGAKDQARAYMKRQMRQMVGERKLAGGAIDLRQIASNLGAPWHLVERTYEAMGEPALAAPTVETDDLTEIKGIGESLEERLKNLGLRTFEALAEIPGSQVNLIAQQLGRPSLEKQIGRWVKEAEQLAKEEE